MAERSIVKACERLEAGDVSLREVMLDSEEVDARFVSALRRPSHLESLEMWSAQLDVDLADALAKQTQLTSLLLYNMEPAEDDVGSHLARSLQALTSLTDFLWWVDNPVDVVPCIAEVVGWLPQLQMLDLDMKLAPSSIRALAEAVAEQGKLQELGLRGMEVGDEGAAHLAAMLEHNRSLSVLGLACCGIKDSGLRLLGRALVGNTTLLELEFCYNGGTQVGLARFFDMTERMYGLQKLVLDDDCEEHVVLPALEDNYSLLELEPKFPAAQPFLQRNARGYAKAYAATIFWLCICRYRRPFGLLPDIGVIIARLVYASRGRVCWIDKDGGADAKRAQRTE